MALHEAFITSVYRDAMRYRKWSSRH